jgi:uncharacterized membrane protein YphA (DoxX/SURF4 family)
MNLKLTNRILLGLVMLVPGLGKALNPSGITDMLDGLTFFGSISVPLGSLAWILIIVEIVAGIAILANYKLNYSVIAPAVILIGAAVTAQWGDFSALGSWGGFFVHLTVATNYALLGGWHKR